MCLVHKAPSGMLRHYTVTVEKPLWSWRESNPRPDEENRCFLHAYSSVNFRYLADVGQPTRYLST